jgi:hypothetical protein
LSVANDVLGLPWRVLMRRTEALQGSARHCHGNFGLASGDPGRLRSAGHAVCRAQVS